ncbi:hypothetical protein ACLB2K_073971 [Fragaria x ananassa]
MKDREDKGEEHERRSIHSWGIKREPYRKCCPLRVDEQQLQEVQKRFEQRLKESEERAQQQIQEPPRHILHPRHIVADDSNADASGPECRLVVVDRSQIFESKRRDLYLVRSSDEPIVIAGSTLSDRPRHVDGHRRLRLRTFMYEFKTVRCISLTV